MKTISPLIKKAKFTPDEKQKKKFEILRFGK